MASVLFDDGPSFADPSQIVEAHTPDELVAALERLERARRGGSWVAGYVSYEAGYALIDRVGPLMPAERDTPLLCFGIFDGPDARPVIAPGHAELVDVAPCWDPERHARAFARLKAYIAAGDVYQGNLTFPLHARAVGSARALYAALMARQSVGHGALVDLGAPAILCRSPELFFDIDAEGRVVARPMKGTAPRGATPEADATLRGALANSPKDQAENLMIVDLLRNDIGRIAQIGSVRVPRLFQVETYETLHQMVSDVTGTLVSGIGLPEIFAALFPCGSITGAPKIRAMEIIAELEDTPRGAYCGAVGWAAPSGASRFSVAIRTISLWPDGRARLNVGGGIVHDSRGADEYQEALWKARFASPAI